MMCIGQRLSKEIEKVVPIEFNEEAHIFVENYKRKMKRYIIVVYTILIAIFCLSRFNIIGTKISIIIILPYFMLCIKVIQTKKSFIRAKNNIFKKDENYLLYRNIQYELLKKRKCKYKIAIIVSDFLISLIMTGKGKEALEIADRLSFLKDETWKFHHDIIKMTYYSMNKKENEVYDVFCHMCNLKISTREKYYNIIRKIYNEYIKLAIINKDTIINVQENCISVLEKVILRKRKKIKIVTLVFTIVLVVSTIVGIYKWATFSYEKMYGLMHHTLEDVKLDDKDFYNSIEESIITNKLDNTQTSENIFEVIEKDNDCIVFSINEYDDVHVINIFRIKKKFENGNSYYSKPISQTEINWENTNQYTYSDCNDLESKIKVDIDKSRYVHEYWIGENKTQILWGIVDDEKIYNLTINKVKPTEIIEFMIGSQKGYLWYYEGLNLKNQDRKNTIIEVQLDLKENNKVIGSLGIHNNVKGENYKAK